MPSRDEIQTMNAIIKLPRVIAETEATLAVVAQELRLLRVLRELENGLSTPLDYSLAKEGK